MSQTFIEKALKVHGDIYDYSRVNYKNMITKVKIVCKKHGEFEQTPNNHIHYLFLINGFADTHCVL